MLAWFRKHKLWVLSIAIAMLIFTTLSFVLTRGYRKVCQYKKSLIAKGEEIDWKKLIPKSPPEKENATPQLDKIIRFFLPLPFDDSSLIAMQIVAPGKARICWKEDSIWTDVQEKWKTQRWKIDTIRPILELPHLDRKLDYGKGLELSLPHLAKMSIVVGWHQIAIGCQARQEDWDGVLNDFSSLFNILRLQSEEPLMVSKQCYLNLFFSVIASIWEVLHAEKWNNNQLQRLQKGLENCSVYFSIKNMLILHRALNCHFLDQVRESRALMDANLAIVSPGSASVLSKCLAWYGNSSVRQSLLYNYWKYFASYYEEMNFLEMNTFAIYQVDRVVQGVPLNVINAGYDTWER